MNEADISELFIRAAEIDRALPERVGPQPPRSVALPYVHDWTDKLGWGSKRLEEERKEFWERLGFLPTSRELSEIEILRAWLHSTDSDSERRCLLAWARAKAGGQAFKRWCFRVEKIHPETGRRRKDRAIAKILAALECKPMENNENAGFGVLLGGPDSPYLPATLDDVAPEPKSFTWRDDPSLRPIHQPEFEDFSWAQKRSERRRQLRAKAEREKNKAA